MSSLPRKISQVRLKELLIYNEDTGQFIRKVSRSGGGQAGSIAGYLSKVGGMTYWRLTVDGEVILGHVLAWFYYYGKWPDSEVDHEDHDGLNNRIKNLRLVGSLENGKNRSKKFNPSGVTGVSLTKGGKYLAHIACEYKKYYLGTYQTLEEATSARRAAELKFNFHPNHGK